MEKRCNAAIRPSGSALDRADMLTFKKGLLQGESYVLSSNGVKEIPFRRELV